MSLKGMMCLVVCGNCQKRRTDDGRDERQWSGEGVRVRVRVRPCVRVGVRVRDLMRVSMRVRMGVRARGRGGERATGERWGGRGRERAVQGRDLCGNETCWAIQKEIRRKEENMVGKRAGEVEGRGSKEVSQAGSTR